MAALLVEGMPPLLWDKHTTSRSQLLEVPEASRSEDIQVFFETHDTRDGRRIFTTAYLSSATTVQQIQLSGKHHGWFKSGDKLVGVANLMQEAFFKVSSVLYLSGIVNCPTSRKLLALLL